MKVALSIALAGLGALVSAQGIADLPSCAQECANEGIPEDCGLDVSCICGSDNFIASITCCVADKCSEDDQQNTIDFANGLCSGAGIDDLPQTAECKTGSSGSATGSASGSATETSSSDPTSSPSPTSDDEEEEGSEDAGNAASPLKVNGGALAAFAAAVMAFV